MANQDDIQEILNKAKERLGWAKLLKKDNGPEESIKYFITSASKKIDNLMELAPYLKEVMLENLPEIENFHNEIEYEIKYLSEYLLGIENELA